MNVNCDLINPLIAKLRAQARADFMLQKAPSNKTFLFRAFKKGFSLSF